MSGLLRKHIALRDRWYAKWLRDHRKRAKQLFKVESKKRLRGPHLSVGIGVAALTSPKAEA